MTDTPTSLTIMHITDIHFGDAAPAALDAALEAIDTLKPDCIALTGDLTQAGRRREFLQAGDWLGKITRPIVAAPGNHDTPVYAIHSRAFSPFGRFGRLGLGGFWTGGNGLAAIASINTARSFQLRRDWSQGAFDLDDVEEAQAKMEKAAPTGWRFLACHHPPFTPAEAQVESRTRRSAKALALLKPAHRTIVLCGHVHGYFFIKDPATSVHSLTAPSLASSRERGAGAGFVLLTVTPASVAIQRWRHDGASFKPAETMDSLTAA